MSPCRERGSRALALSALVALACGCGAMEETVTKENDLVQNRGEGKDAWWEALPRPAWSAFEKVLESESWFEVYAVRPGIYAIYEPGQFEEVISYLVIGSERALLFDTGLGIGDISEVVSKLTSVPVVVLNSHTHYDHVGDNHRFETIYGTETQFTRTNAKGKDHAEVAEFVSEGWIWKETPEGFSRDAYHTEPFTVSKTVEDGEVLDLGDRRLEVLLTSGHAPDALCLLDRENRLLFTGDTFYPAVLYAHLPGSDVATYRRTAERLAGLEADVDVLIPSHNEPLVPADNLGRMREAFEAIASGEASYVVTDGNREYAFEGFSVLTPDPLP